MTAPAYLTRAGAFCRALDISPSTLSAWRREGRVLHEYRGPRSFRYETPESFRRRQQTPPPVPQPHDDLAALKRFADDLKRAGQAQRRTRAQKGNRL